MRHRISSLAAEAMVGLDLQAHAESCWDFPRTNHSRVARELGIDIVSGRLSENSILPGDTELLNRFRVSRTILREALKTLSAKGLIEAKAKIGTRVLERRFWNMFDPSVLRWHAQAGTGPEFLLSLSEMRFSLESEAAALAARRRSPHHVQELHRCVKLMQRAEQSPEEFVNSDLLFHLAVAEASLNPFMRSISSLIEVALVVTFQFSSPIPGSPDHRRVVDRHSAVANAIADQNEKVARKAMQAVVQDSIDRLKTVKVRKRIKTGSSTSGTH
jgi:DNA-binding FadR family transcriptional regulator